MLFQSSLWLRAGAIGAGLLVRAASGFGQQPSPPASPHWYLGVQGGVQQQVYSVSRYGTGLTTTVAGVYGGYAPSAGLAIQAGVLFGRGATPVETPSGVYTYYPEYNQITKAWSIPVLMRVSFGHSPHRFGVEGLVGARVCSFVQRTVGGHKATEPRLETTANGVNGFVDLGIGGRLRLGSRLDVVSDVLLNFNVRRAYNSYLPVSPGFGATLGLTYRLP